MEIEIELKEVTKEEQNKLFDKIFTLTKKFRKSEVNAFLYLKTKKRTLCI